MYVTRSSRGGWSSVVQRSDYGNVISNYAAALQQASVQQRAVDLETKVFNYKNGLLSYGDLKKYLDTALTKELPGSQKELDLRQTMTSVDTYENTKNKNIERSKLEAKFASNGISASERVQIENDLLKFYKEGTPEYTEQLSTIATANELQRVEEKNIKVARIEAKLSEGGLSTSDKISLYEDMRDFTDKGSAEYANVQSKVNLLKEQKSEEDLTKKRNDVVAAFIDEHKAGGLDNKELLELNKKMQTFTKPGTNEMVDLKEKEAKILEAIQSDNISSGKKGTKVVTEDKAIELNKLEAQLGTLENKFEIGSISQEEYLQTKNQIVSAQTEIVNQYGDVASPSVKGELQNRLDELTNITNKIRSGEAVTVVGLDKTQGIKKQRIVSLQELITSGGAYGEDEEVVTELDKDGNVLSTESRKVVTAMVDGKEKRYIVDEKTGKLEVVKEQTVKQEGKPVKGLVKTGLQFNKVSSPGSSKGSPTVSGPGVEPVLGMEPSSTTSAPSTGSGKSSGSSGSSNSSSKGSSSNSKSSSPKIDFTPTVSKAAESIKNTFTTGTSYASSPTIAKIGPVNVKQGNIKGTLDFGITEKLGVGEKLKKAKSAFSNLFKRR